MARTPSALRRDLDELDAEARAYLRKWRLPMWLGLYCYRDAQGNPTTGLLPSHRAAAVQGVAIPTIEAHRPVMHCIIRAADDALDDPAARHLMRLWMAGDRKRRAKRQGDREGARAAGALYGHLLSRPPSLNRGARNIARENAKRDAARNAEWDRWQAEANSIWAQYPKLSCIAVADLVKKRLGLLEHVQSIARRLIQPPK
jgi:hypothetical protein